MAVLEVKDLLVHFTTAAKDRNAVDHISFSIQEGEILGLVGESGSGKTVTAMACSALLPEKNVVTSGSVAVNGKEMLGISDRDAREIRGDDINVVFQEPMTSMNPLIRVGEQVEECLHIHHREIPKAELKRRAIEALAQVELPDPEGVYEKYPHELSGGMLQRAMIASAIINKPDLLLADEPTTALDVTVQAQILKLLKKLNEETGMAILFISHNLNVVRKLCSRIIVMQGGHIVEEGDVEQIFNNPQHPYTQKLIAAIPSRSKRYGK